MRKKMGEFIPEYSKYKTSELLDIYLRMDKLHNPMKKVSIENEIRKRLNISEQVNLDDFQLLKTFEELSNVVEKQKSRLVNVVAWIAIVLSGISILFSIINLFVFSGNLNSLLEDANIRSMLTPTAKYYMEHQEVFIIIGLVYYTIQLISGLGLLKRKEWSRKMFVWLLTIMIIYSMASPVISQLFVPNLQFIGPGNESYSLDSMKPVVLTMRLFWGLIISALYGFVLYKLTRTEITEEFISQV